MRLAIADPPYLGRAHRWYGDSTRKYTNNDRREATVSDVHPDAQLWDDPATHEALVARLVRDFDGWAVAMHAESLGHYLRWVPSSCRVAIWHDPRRIPSGHRVRRVWEPVVVYVPQGRRDRTSGPAMTDLLSAVAPQTFVGAKPAAWTRWVLDMLGYDAETDTVNDLFHGSGAVAAEVAQGVLL